MPLSSVKLKDDDRVNVEPTAVAGISAFLGKLWKMVEDPKTDELIQWGKVTNGNELLQYLIFCSRSNTTYFNCFIRN